MGGELGLERSGEQIVGWAGEHGVLVGCNLDEQRLESVIHLEMKEGDPPPPGTLSFYVHFLL